MYSEYGLSRQQAEEYLKRFGLNDVSEKKVGFLKKFLVPLYSPISLMLLGAAVLSRINGRVFDFYFILILYFVNYFIQKWQEFKADKAIEHLREKLSFNVLVKREGNWQSIEAKYLVPRDYIKLALGSIIPADSTVVVSKNLTVNEAVLTGESLPKEKKTGDKIFSGSFISTGSLEAVVEATGKNTYFGKTIFSIEQPTEKSVLEREILSISKFLTIISIIAVLILTTIFLFKRFPINELLTLDLSLVIAGIPIALPAVMAIILSIGASGLAKKMVIVRRLSSLEDLANVNLLLTDKTGTLTNNRIRVVNAVSYQSRLDTNDIVRLASFAVAKDNPDAISTAILKKLEEVGNHTKAEVLDFIPYDSERKRSTAFIQKERSKMLISLGAPQIIESLDEFSSKLIKKKFEETIVKAANNGYRVLALATKKGDSKEEKHMKMAGLLFLADPLDESAKSTLKFIQDSNIEVKMVTGDNKAIAQRIAKDLNLSGKIVSERDKTGLFGQYVLAKEFEEIAGFAEVMPKDKYEIVKAARVSHTVAVTGDGINDLPALKTANVGIAVSGSVSALKSMADIVLLQRGLSVIKDAILESRKIFIRLYNYSLYRISESFRLVVSILILGLWYGFYPLLPLQLIVLVLLNDIPIISLAVDRVKISARPSKFEMKQRFILSLLFGSVGILNSIILFYLMTKVLHLPLAYAQTMFFLKLTVSGHSLIFVAHTKERWYKFLPSKEVIFATLGTQAIATALAVSGFLMPSSISIGAAVFVWVWSLFWMQVSELMKVLQEKILDR